MKLRQINENLMMHQLRDQLIRTGPNAIRPSLHQGLMYNPASGNDAGARNAGATTLPTGVPHKIRHRQFLGLENRPGTIRL